MQHERPPAGNQWVHEVKVDGYRGQLQLREGTARVFSRRGNDWTQRLESIAHAAVRSPRYHSLTRFDSRAFSDHSNGSRGAARRSQQSIRRRLFDIQMRDAFFGAPTNTIRKRLGALRVGAAALVRGAPSGSWPHLVRLIKRLQ